MLVQSRVQSAGLLSFTNFALDVVGGLVSSLLSTSLLSGLLDANLDTIVLLVPLLEWGRINLNDGVLDEGLGTD